MATVLSALLLAQGASAATLALYNRCPETVWPGIQPSAGKEALARGGMQLPPNRATSIRLPTGWSGRVWGRQGCKFDAAGRGRCATGDCGGAPPATLAEVTLAAAPSAQDFYDVSLVDGYNLPIAMAPYHGKGANCVPAGCVSDLNRVCPAGLAVREGGGGPSSGAAAPARRSGRRSTAARGGSAGRSSAGPRPTPGCSSRRAPRRTTTPPPSSPAPPARPTSSRSARTTAEQWRGGVRSLARSRLEETRTASIHLLPLLVITLPLLSAALFSVVLAVIVPCCVCWVV